MTFSSHAGRMNDEHHGHVPSRAPTHPARRHALAHRVRHAIRPHSHDHGTDAALEASAEGWRTLWISLAALAATAGAQAAVVVLSGSVALLGDTLHNAADALTAVPIGVAFLLGRRHPTRRYTYGYGRAEDLAGIAIVVVIAISCAVAAFAAVQRLTEPRPVTHLAAVAIAAVLGFAGNELVARYRIRTGRRIGSAALVADGRHARADGFTSLAVLAGAGGMALGWTWADPVIGLAITAAILMVGWQAAREVGRRLMDSVDPALTDRGRDDLAGDPGGPGRRASAAALGRAQPPGRVRDHGRSALFGHRGARGRGQRRAPADPRHPPPDRRPGARRSTGRRRPSRAAGRPRRRVTTGTNPRNP
jgi:cation diffusion facilitator family transporter